MIELANLTLEPALEQDFDYLVKMSQGIYSESDYFQRVYKWWIKQEERNKDDRHNLRKLYITRITY